MNDSSRPDPDTLLARVEREENQRRRGRLKVFFGAAAGVGKTYAMLLAAKAKRDEGVDVVVGLVETHDRPETVAVLKGLDVLPPKLVKHHGTVLREFDLDGVLKRRPSLVLVDELAHSNVAGCRHPKRWQDVEELLHAGIDVYSTLNVQHLESLNDDVSQVTGIQVKETVPDTVFEMADDVELIDLPPDELLLRLKEGKVYLPQQAERAMRNFFRKGNLIALRELSLRLTADRVDAQMQDYRENHAISDVWPVGDRILVCIGPNPIAERLVRAAKRLATSLHAHWIVAYVETPELQRLPADRRDEVLRVLRFAEQLGAETATLSGPDMSREILGFAKSRNITKIVLGKPSRRGWKRWLLGSVVDTLIVEAHNINVYLLGSPRGKGRAEQKISKEMPLTKALRPNYPWGRGKRRWLNWGWAVGMTACTSLAAWLMSGKFELANLVMVYLLGVVFMAARFGREASVLTSVLSVAAFDFLFVNPVHTFVVADVQYLVTFLIMLLVGLIISHLTSNMRSQAKVASHRERRANVLYALSEELATSRSVTEAATVAVRHIQDEFGGNSVLLFPDDDGRIVYPVDPPVPESLLNCDLSVAQWVFDHGQIAGQGTDTLPGADAVYFPMSGFRGVIGVLVLRAANLRRVFLPEQRRLLDTFISQIAQTIERVRFADEAQQTQLRMESESLRNSLLSAISHDLRTPLASIVGAASTLVEEDAQLDASDRKELSLTIYDEALRMSNLTNNILDMARLDAGQASLNRQWYLLDEIIGGTLTRMKKRLKGRAVNTKLPDELCLVRVDAVLIEQVLVNLLENACKYTQPGSPIDIVAELSAHMLKVTVADRGPGIPPGEEEKLFDKFYRVHREGTQSGVGLGLAICKAIIMAHGGVIGATNRQSGGAQFFFLLPVDEAPPQLAAEPMQDE
ncbi:sensor histidine kinase [Candidatus Methylobacter oryzae]|uniref:histidine kinase n=1 Tax=Candidatus Methylobacter oryzae TaxID=2497749 RepID=A0ABY3CA07_9GAMM|nr:sensor histidine kinase KdpD [Candidatus Methylobacter oryzae]TRW94441.1 sensor histidine kinase KdpD [Candidatus Methylobacter oryzae]